MALTTLIDMPARYEPAPTQNDGVWSAIAVGRLCGLLKHMGADVDIKTHDKVLVHTTPSAVRRGRLCAELERDSLIDSVSMEKDDVYIIYIRNDRGDAVKIPMTDDVYVTVTADGLTEIFTHDTITSSKRVDDMLTTWEW